MTNKACLVGMLVMVLAAPIVSGCMVTFPEHGRAMSVSPAPNPNDRESRPAPSGPGLAYDDGRTASR